MRYIKLGNSKIKTSRLGIGALHFGIFCNQKQTSKIIHSAIDNGINFIDTSPLYGNGSSENFIKNSIINKRNELVISSKVGLKKKLLSDGSWGVKKIKLNEKNIRLSVESSLKSLGTDYIDLFQIHAFDYKTDIEDTYGSLLKLYEEGKIREIGCSNHNAQELKLVIAITNKMGIKLAASQNHYNLIERRAENEISPITKENKICFISNRALARGILSGQYKKVDNIPLKSRAHNSKRIRKLITPEIISLIAELNLKAKSNGQKLSQLALSWQLDQNYSDLILLGVRNLKQLNLSIRSLDFKNGNSLYRELDKIIFRSNYKKLLYNLPKVFLEK
ncbi:aldo/keto reductase [Alphaproteobacteria bacterium]|nr:aldo/keto reductase [Alphaproteobacteria bacterium]